MMSISQIFIRFFVSIPKDEKIILYIYNDDDRQTIRKKEFSLS
jgi:hypothetical protein